MSDEIKTTKEIFAEAYVLDDDDKKWDERWRRVGNDDVSDTRESSIPKRADESISLNDLDLAMNKIINSFAINLSTTQNELILNYRAYLKEEVEHLVREVK